MPGENSWGKPKEHEANAINKIINAKLVFAILKWSSSIKCESETKFVHFRFLSFIHELNFILREIKIERIRISKNKKYL